MNNGQHIRNEYFDKINWFPIDQRFKQSLYTYVFKLFTKMCTQYMNKIYKTPNQNNTRTRNLCLKLFQPLKTKNTHSEMFVLFRGTYSE